MHQIDPMKRERATAVLVDFCHTKLRFRKIKIFWALPWKNLRLLMWPKNPISSYFGQNSEMQNCQDYTDPTVPSLYPFVNTSYTLHTRHYLWGIYSITHRNNQLKRKPYVWQLKKRSNCNDMNHKDSFVLT